MPKRTTAQGTKWKGGYHKLPKLAKRQGINRYGIGKVPKKDGGFWGGAYQNEHFMRTGKYGKKEDSKVYARHMSRSMKANGASLAGAGATLAAAHHNSTPGVYAGLGAVVGGMAYSSHQQHKANKFMRQKTGTKESMLGGYYNPKPKKGRRK